jgi:hypothetical protein
MAAPGHFDGLATICPSGLLPVSDDADGTGREAHPRLGRDTVKWAGKAVSGNLALPALLLRALPPCDSSVKPQIPRWLTVHAASDLCGSITNFFAAPLSKSR